MPPCAPKSVASEEINSQLNAENPREKTANKINAKMKQVNKVRIAKKFENNFSFWIRVIF